MSDLGASPAAPASTAAAVCSDLGPAILRARTASGLTQAQLAARAGISAPMISKYENGAHQPPLEALVAMAVVLGTSLDRLTGLAAARMPPLPALSPVRDALAGLPDELGDAVARILGGLLAIAGGELPAGLSRRAARRRIEPVLLRAGLAADLVPGTADEIALLVAGPVASPTGEPAAAAPDVAARP